MLVNLKETGGATTRHLHILVQGGGGGVVRRQLVEKTDWGSRQRSGQRGEDRPWTRGRKKVGSAGSVLILLSNLEKNGGNR